jgi:Ca2+-transporting ATPase
MAILIESPVLLFIFFHDLTDIARARTELFFLFIVIELTIAVNFRSLRHSIFRLPPHSWLVAAIISQLVLSFLILASPTITQAFGIGMPYASDVAVMVILSVAVFGSMELIKLYLRKKAV